MAKIGGLWIVQAIFCGFHHCLIWYIRLKMTGRRLNAFLEKGNYQSKYEEKTTLQRNAKRFMQNGGKLGVGIGILNKNDI